MLYKPWRPKGYFQFEININVLVTSLRFIWYYVMGLRPVEIFNSYSAVIDFSRQNLTFTDVRFWRLKTIPALYRLNHYSRYNLFYKSIESLTFGMRWVFKNPKLQMFGLKVTHVRVICTHLKLWVAVARHNLKWVKI